MADLDRDGVREIQEDRQEFLEDRQEDRPEKRLFDKTWKLPDIEKVE